MSRKTAGVIHYTYTLASTAGHIILTGQGLNDVPYLNASWTISMTEQEMKLLLVRGAALIGEDMNESSVNTLVRSVIFRRESGAAADRYNTVI